MDSRFVLVLIGPTGCGKTDLLLELFGSGARPGLPAAELVSADSMQVYRGMDIGTAKPSARERALLPHHLLDLRDPDEQYMVGDFVRLADEACGDIASRGRLPIVAGGTGFYVRNFLFGLPSGPEADPAIRAAVARDLAQGGPEALRAELAALDPAAAERIKPRDLYRLCRAVEIQRQTGRPQGDFAPPTSLRSRWNFLVVELARPRDEVYARIGTRVEAMMAAGLADEVAALRAAGYGPGDPGLKAIGYSEFLEAEAEGRGRDLPAIAQAIKLDTRRYAKRQLTFFRGIPGRLELALGSGGLALPQAQDHLVQLILAGLEKG